jgi:hypothetical protein
MDNTDFYNDKKYCQDCGDYVPYLHSIDTSYCAVCGAKVRLFSDNDWESFHESLRERRPKGGRPRKRDKESA